MKKRVLILLIAVFAAASAYGTDEKVVRVSFVITENLIKPAGENSTVVTFHNDHVNISSLILPFLEMDCTQGQSMISLNSGNAGFSNMIVSEGTVQLFFHPGDSCGTERRNPVNLTVVLFIVSPDQMVNL
ncbi:MAG: hypothetical protein HN368_02140 [Spirochaetales bacterium]|jgi:hypothetical protein|nr:hypothetical protein [Spirochaetales bacterium]